MAMFKVKLHLSILILCLWLSSAERDFQFENVSSDGTQITLTEAPVEHTKPVIHKPEYAQEVSQCPYTERRIMLSLVLKSLSWDEILESKKSRALRKLCKFFAIPKEYIHASNASPRDLHKKSQRSITRGRNKCEKDRTLGKIEFMIGCGSKYFASGEPISNQIGQQMRDGSINEFSGLDFGWWVIWNKTMNNRVQRYKREAAAGSGDGEGDGDDYDYDYEEGDDEDDDDEDLEHVTEIPAVTTHAHRHHHGIPKNPEEEKSVVHRISNVFSTLPTSVDIGEDDDDTGDEDDIVPETSTILPEIEETHVEVTTPTTTTTTIVVPKTQSTTPATTSQLPPITTTTRRPTTTTTTTTTTPLPLTTAEIEAESANMPPMIKNRLPKQPVTAGKPFSLTVPAEMFYDNEDGTNLRVELFDKMGNALKGNSWIQFDSEKREIYGLPLEDAVSRWQYKLVATDSKNESVTETLDFSVQQHKGHRSVNHEITIAVKLNKKFQKTIDWQIRLIRGIVETLNDNTMSSVVVREIRQNQQDPHSATFIYTNETLPKDKCPEEKLDELVKRLDYRKLTDSLLPELSVKSVTAQPIGPCQKPHAPKPKPTPHMTKNYPPVPRNQVDRVNATIGHLLVYKVPSDTFYDPEDTTDLKLSLLTIERSQIKPTHWLQFDSKNQEFFGIPKTGDFGSEEYLLVAEDHEGLQATDALVVVVNQPPKREYSVLFKVTLGIRYDAFTNAQMQRKFIERLAQLFGDPTPANIQIRSIQHLPDGESIMISFYNTTLVKTHHRCPAEDIEMIRNIWYQSDTTLKERVKKIMGNEFNIIGVTMNPLGNCNVLAGDISHERIPIKTEDRSTSSSSSFKDDYLLTFILPAILILAMVLLASVIACVLHRRRLTGKMELGDEEERRSFRSKGIPVIFQDELDEKPEIGNKSPIILKDEKPPLLPPSYNSTNLDGDNDVDEYVPPPAVMGIMGGREARGKSPVTPSYRKPPPYVSP